MAGCLAVWLVLAGINTNTTIYMLKCETFRGKIVNNFCTSAVDGVGWQGMAKECTLAKALRMSNDIIDSLIHKKTSR